MSKTPSHRAYVVKKRPANADGSPNDFWMSVGSLWPHEDGKGWNLQLDALPTGDGKLVIRVISEKPVTHDEDGVIEEAPPAPAKKAPASSSYRDQSRGR